MDALTTPWISAAFPCLAVILPDIIDCNDPLPLSVTDTETLQELPTIHCFLNLISVHFSLKVPSCVLGHQSMCPVFYNLCHIEMHMLQISMKMM